MSEYRSFAFISYSHRDMAVAKWLQRRLEGFKLPTEVHNDIDAKSRYLRPVFRDQSDLNTGILGDELRRHLEESKFLILVCSCNSRNSQWVSDEAKAFVEMGRLDHIIPVIIPDGDTAERELFPAFLRNYFDEKPESELLGISLGEVSREKALIRIVSKMLGVSFDSLWMRHLRQKRIKMAVSASITTLALVLLYLFAVPVCVDIDVDLQKANLPVGDKINITVDGAYYDISPKHTLLSNVKVPGYKRFGNISMTVSSQFFNTVDTTCQVGLGIRKHVNVSLYRDSSFAIYAGCVYDADMVPLEGVAVSVGPEHATTDDEGRFKITFPVDQQRVEQSVVLRKDGYTPVVRDDETPGTDIKYIMRRR